MDLLLKICKVEYCNYIFSLLDDFPTLPRTGLKEVNLNVSSQKGMWLRSFFLLIIIHYLVTITLLGKGKKNKGNCGLSSIKPFYDELE